MLVIDTLTETVLPLVEVPEHCPRCRGRKKIHTSTVFRWAKGDLETIMIGGTRCTSLEALQRYFERRTAQKDGITPRAGAGRSPGRRLKESERAGRLLEKMGA